MDTQAAESLNTMTAAFSDRACAENAAAELVAIGIDRNTVKVFPDAAADPQLKDSAFNPDKDDRGLFDSLSHLVLTDEERYSHAERLHRGIVMVSVLVDENHAEQAQHVLESLNPIDIDEEDINTRMLGDSEGRPTHRRRVRMYAARS